MLQTENNLFSKRVDPDFTALYSAWRGWRSDGRLPSRSDFDPMAHVRLLPNITLFEIDSTSGRIKLRLIGTSIDSLMSRDRTGMYLDEMENTEAIEERCRALCDTRRPYFVCDQPVTWEDDNNRLYATLGLPLAEDGETVNMILYLMKFYWVRLGELDDGTFGRSADLEVGTVHASSYDWAAPVSQASP